MPGSSSLRRIHSPCPRFTDNNILLVSLLQFNPSHSVVKAPQPCRHIQNLSLLPSSQVKYRSDLNLTRGVGWTPPGSYKVEMARRAAELANARALGVRGAYVSSKLQTPPAWQDRRKDKAFVSFQSLFLTRGQLALKKCEMQLSKAPNFMGLG